MALLGLPGRILLWETLLQRNSDLWGDGSYALDGDLASRCMPPFEGSTTLSINNANLLYNEFNENYRLFSDHFARMSGDETANLERITGLEQRVGSH